MTHAAKCALKKNKKNKKNKCQMQGNEGVLRGEKGKVNKNMMRTKKKYCACLLLTVPVLRAMCCMLHMLHAAMPYVDMAAHARRCIEGVKIMANACDSQCLTHN